MSACRNINTGVVLISQLLDFSLSCLKGVLKSVPCPRPTSSQKQEQDTDGEKGSENPCSHA